MNTVCEVCGHIGFKHLLLCCRDCTCSAVHQYCLEKVVFDASLADWVCYECLQKRGEVTCRTPLEIVSSERPPSHAHSDSTVHQQVTKRVSGVGLWTNRKSHMVKCKSLHKLFSSKANASQKKLFKRKPNMRPMDNCTYRRRQIGTSTDHAKSLQSCETVGAATTKGNGGNQHAENDTVSLNIKHHSSLVINCLGDTNQSHLLKGTEGLSHKWKDSQSLTNPFEGIVMKKENVGLGSKKLEPSHPTAEHEKCGDASNGMTNSGANIYSEKNDHDNPSNELLQKNMVVNIPQLFTLENNALDNEISGASNNGCAKVLSCASIKNIPGIRETNAHSGDVSSSSQHGNAESSESSERFVGCQNGSFCDCRKIVKMATTSMSLEDLGEDIPTENGSIESDDLQAPPMGDYILSRTSYLSEAQKERVMAFIQETRPEITVFVSVIRKSSVQPPGPYLGISKEYAFAYFPHESTKVTLQMPGMSKTWHPLFYKRDENRKNFLMGRWLDFVRDNNVQEGDICLLEPTKDERRSTFTVYLLRASATHATDGDGFRRVGPYPGESIVKITSQVRNKEKPSNAKHVPSERVVHEISRESPESEDSGDPILVPYIVPCRHDLSKSQKKIIEMRVRAIRSEVPIYVTVMKNNNAGAAQRWMLELGVRYAAEYLPAEGQTVVLKRRGETWNTQMVIHNGRRWFLNGGWTKFARDNGLRVGDICLFELKTNEKKLTMEVHIITREQF